MFIAMSNVTIEDRGVIATGKFPGKDEKCFHGSKGQQEIISGWHKYVSGFKDGRADAKCNCDGNKQTWCIRTQRQISKGALLVGLNIFLLKVSFKKTKIVLFLSEVVNDNTHYDTKHNFIPESTS